MNVGDKVILLDNVITERLKFGYSGADDILISYIDKTLIIKYISDDNILTLKINDNVNDIFRWINIIPTSVKLLSEMRKDKIIKLQSKL
jgi:hypothetical protein